MTRFHFKVTCGLVGVALSCKTEEAFLARGEIAGQSPWYDGDDWDAVKEDMRTLYRIAQGGFPAIAKDTGMTQAALSKRLCVPLRTVQGWWEGTRKPVSHIICMMMEVLYG